MGSPLNPHARKVGKRESPKQQAARIRMIASKKETSLGEHAVLNQLADAVEDGKTRVKIAGQTVSLDTPELIAKIVEDVKKGKY